jgi:hypothetical protein
MTVTCSGSTLDGSAGYRFSNRQRLELCSKIRKDSPPPFRWIPFRLLAVNELRELFRNLRGIQAGSGDGLLHRKTTADGGHISVRVPRGLSLASCGLQYRLLFR